MLRSPTTLLLGTLFLLLLGYANSFDAPFLFDDQRNIAENPILTEEMGAMERIVSLWETPNGKRIVPLFTFSWNLRTTGTSLFELHAVNLLVHILAAYSLFLLLKIILVRFKEPDAALYAALGAGLWALHPLHTQSVTYLVQRMNSMAGLFFILGHLYFLKSRLEKPALMNSLLCSLSFLLSFFSKEWAFIAPLSVVLLEWLVVREGVRPRIKDLLLYGTFVLCLGYLALSLHINGNVFAFMNKTFEVRHFTLFERVMTEWRVVLFYLSLFFLPLPGRLSLEHDFSLSRSLFTPPSTALTLLGIIGLLFAAYRGRKTQKLFALSIFWYFLTLAIESSFLSLELVFEHRSYIPTIFIPLTLLLFLKNYLRRTSLFSFAIVAGFLLTFWTYERNQDWRDPYLFWTDAAEKAPGQARAHYNVAALALERGKIEKAAHHFKTGLSHIKGDPHFAQKSNYLTGLGLAEARLKNWEASKTAFEESLALAPGNTKALYGHGTSLFHLEELEQAAASLQQAYSGDPKLPGLSSLLAKSLTRLGTKAAQARDPEKALQYHKESLIYEELAQAHNGIGAIYGARGDMAQALGHFRRATEIDPNFKPARDNLRRAEALQSS